MEITIIGWYGTETIGDRAILAGLFNVMSDVYSSFRVRIGSLYPFFTEKTIEEDYPFYEAQSSNKLLSISVFDSRNPQQLCANIKHCDLVVVGGGPLMDLWEMNMLEYAFVKAKEYLKKSFLMGCGWGPLKDKKIIAKAIHLVEIADGIIFRDITSKVNYLKVCAQYKEKIESSIDPAFFACDYYLQHQEKPRLENHIAINFRDISIEGDHYSKTAPPESLFIQITENIVSNTNQIVNLVPMHYFAIGGDDRVLLNKIEKTINLPNLKAIHNPLTLQETMDTYYHASICVGMRFHSIVMQTMLNGNNYIIDYTDLQNGKIIGMMNQLKLHSFYENRYFSLYANGRLLQINPDDKKRYHYDREMIQLEKKVYHKLLNRL